MAETHKRRIVVTFELETTDEYWQEAEVEKEQLLDDIATYLTSRVESDNQTHDPFWLRDTTVYWIGDFMEAAAQGEVEIFEEDLSD